MTVSDDRGGADRLLVTSIDQIDLAAYQTDCDGRIVRFNKAAEALWRDRPASSAPSPSELVETADSKVQRGRKRRVRTGPSAAGQNGHGGQSDPYPLQVHHLQLTDSAGAGAGTLTLLVEGPERSADMSELTQAKAWLEGVFSSDVVGLTVFNLETLKTLHANDRMLDLIGATRFEFATGLRSCLDATPAEHRALDDAAIDEARHSGYWQPFEKEYERPDGSRVPVRVSSAPMPLFPNHIVVCVEDLTERREAERQLDLLRSEVNHLARVSAMGTMASILAHEVSQPLVAVSNILAALNLFADQGVEFSDSRVKEQLALARLQSQRAAELLRRIRHFASPGKEQRVEVDLEQAIEEAAAIALLRSPDVELAVAIGPDAGTVIGDPLQVQQVLANVLRNAAEAMERRGRVSIAAVRLEATVEVAVSDEGPGFAAETEAHMFEPFRTTKADGTGLGLSVCRSIIEQHGGRIYIDRAAPGGRVVFTLPAH